MSATPAEDIGIGSVLRDTYELISVLGRGGMGKVFLARHLRLPGKQVAVKVLHTQEEITPDQYARFRREAEITSRLGHPNIVGVLDFYGQEGGAPCLVMEHLKGESLSQRIRRGPFALDEVMSIARQVGSALHAAHQVGVVHRDLKPGNIFLVPTEVGGEVSQQVKLLDFGISKIVSSQTMQTVDDVLMGTPQYMSPEQAMGQNSTLDARSDLFALGSIVYEMLAGRSAFPAPTAFARLGAVLLVVDAGEPLAGLRRQRRGRVVLEELLRPPGDAGGREGLHEECAPAALGGAHEIVVRAGHAR